MKRNIIKWSLCLCTAAVLQTAAAQEAEQQAALDNYHKYARQASAPADPAKEQAILSYRNYFARNGYRKGGISAKGWEKNDALLQADGTFSDLDDRLVGKSFDGNEANSGAIIVEALNRLWTLSEAFKSGLADTERHAALWDKWQKAILHYGRLETGRPNNSRRFHSSCFAIPTAAMNIYFCHLPLMDAVERGDNRDTQLSAVCDMLKMLALQAWTQPYRGDDTDRNVVQTDRFRNHVWWVGGNALGYRSLLPVAFMFRSAPMVDLLAEICRKAISATSQNTYNESFWNEGFTADGAGWGHGKQCLIWGYPIDGTLNALNMLGILKGSPWEQKLTRENVEALMNYFRGGNYYYYKGYILPCLDRYSMSYRPEATEIRYNGMLKQLLNDWSAFFTDAEQQELKQLLAESREKSIRMEAYGDNYNGTRWFFNNDDLIKKNERYHIMVNMASSRCDGLESATGFADNYNFYTADGATFFQKSGNEYRKAFGAYDVTALPGVTAREGMDRLTPVTNWRGYCSRHNFAAAATRGGENAVAGFIYEKMNGSDKEGVNDKGDHATENPTLYGVKAYKSYFMLGDYLVALGAGITNKQPGLEGNIRTTIEQTEKTGDVYTYRGKGIEWTIQQGKFAYSVFPEYRKRVHSTCKTRKTDWLKMNQDNKNKRNLPAEVDIFSLWIDHGRTPVNDTYGYVVYAGEGRPAPKYPFEVLRNDTLVQAVRSADKRVTEAIFYAAGEVLKAKRLSLSASAPCTVLIEEEQDAYIFAVTDACMDASLQEIELVFNGKTLQVPMPQGMLCGKPAVKRLSK
ncbi:MAG: polysaccharide lyase [Bacteroides sp.]|nr:polysaccharide lyase [Bacteroides sp.]